MKNSIRYVVVCYHGYQGWKNHGAFLDKFEAYKLAFEWRWCAGWAAKVIAIE